jgi:hypothetical protein
MSLATWQTCSTRAGSAGVGDLNVRTLGSQIGSQAWAKDQIYFNGTASG